MFVPAGTERGAMKLYRCDGCKDAFALPPELTIENTSTIERWSEPGEWHACSWRCVAEIAQQNDEGMR